MLRKRKHNYSLHRINAKCLELKTKYEKRYRMLILFTRKLELGSIIHSDSQYL